MRLVGVPNSPYFRRVAISLELLEVPFEVEPLSPFIDVEALRRINAVMKVPSLICDDGEVLMDSSLILQFVETALAQGRSLWSQDLIELPLDYRAVSLALAAIEKCLQIVYETRLRPEDTRHQPWLDRIEQQCRTAFAELEALVQARPQAFQNTYSQASITTAVAWKFSQSAIAGSVNSVAHPALNALSERMEALPVFKKYS